GVCWCSDRDARCPVRRDGAGCGPTEVPGSGMSELTPAWPGLAYPGSTYPGADADPATAPDTTDVYEVRTVEPEEALLLGAVPEFSSEFPVTTGYLAVQVPQGLVDSGLLNYRTEAALYRGGVEVPNSRAIIRERVTSGTEGEDQGNQTAMVTWGGQTLLSALTYATVYPVNHPNPDPPHHSFPTATPGAVMKTLLTREQDRGSLLSPPIGHGSFTPEADSNGVLWSNTVSMVFDAGVDLLSALEAMVNLGVVEVEM